MSNISFSEDAWEDYLYWQLQDKKTLKKINELLKEIQRTPFSGKAPTDTHGGFPFARRRRESASAPRCRGRWREAGKFGVFAEHSA